MEPSAPNLHLRKRKQRSQSPSSAIFTRSKAQIYVHRNRSGRARHDKDRKPVHQFAEQLFSPPTRKPESQNANDGIPIKDLRARRVFSTGPAVHDPARKPAHQFVQLSNLLRKPKSPGNADDDMLIEDLRAQKVLSTSPAHSPGPKSDLGFSGNVDLCGSDEGHGVMVNEGIENIDGSGKKGADFMLLKAEDDETESRKNELVLDVGVDQTKGSNSTSKMVVNMHTRRKVFKAPSSLSYRRLLPFLKDIAKDESRILKIERVNAGFSGKSTNSNHENCNLETSNLQSVMNYSNATKCKNASEHSDDGNLRNGEMHKVEEHSPSKLQDSDVVSNNVSAILDDCGLNNGKLKDDENGLNGGNELMEECVQMTPPDADIFSKTELDCAGENAEGKCPETNRVCGHILDGGISTNEVYISSNSHESPNQKAGTISKTKPVLNPCSRLKVFKPLGSVSYRRLLPYLMSVDKTNSCVLRIGDQATAKKDLERDEGPALLASSKEETPINETKPESSIEKKWTANEEQNQRSLTVPPTYGSADNLSPNLSVRQLCSSNDSSDREPSSVTSSNINDHPDMQTEVTPEPDGVVSGCYTEFGPQLFCDNVKSFQSVPSYSAVLPCVNDEIRPTDSTLEVLLYEQDGNGQDCTAVDNVQLVSLVAMEQKSSSDEASDEPRNHIDGPRRGILKRNPRGCRGLCECLSCVSFHLNAERAFEFSRNQMQDAEEVALELIKELNDIRHMLENSAANVNDLAVIQLNQLQVEESCRKALETEKRAKERLSQMNQDLNIHCRIRSLHRPRVAFSCHDNEEKVIPPRWN